MIVLGGFAEDPLFIIVFGPLNSDSNRMRWGEERATLITVSEGWSRAETHPHGACRGEEHKVIFGPSRPLGTAMQPPTRGGGVGGAAIHTQSSSNAAAPPASTATNLHQDLHSFNSLRDEAAGLPLGGARR